MNLTDVEFAKAVNADLRDESTEEEAAYLRSPEGLDRWERELLRIKRSTETQLASGKARRAEAYLKYADRKMSDHEWNQWVADYEHWRAGAIRVKNSTEGKLADLKYARRELYPQSPSEEVERLRNAIREHRYGMTDEDFEVSALDEKLWAVI